MTNLIADNLKAVTDKIRTAELKSGRQPGSVRLVAVSKFHPEEAVLQAVSCGQLLFGENRVQEAAAKFTQIKARFPEVILHIIGTLQRNKVKQAVTVADCIQSVDRLQLIPEIEKHAAALKKNIAVLFEIHTGEDSKAGFTDMDELLRTVDAAAATAHVIPAGFMTMAPFTQNETEITASFQKLVSIQHAVQVRFPELPLTELSMGMSNDFQAAIAEGATMVRIGTAIFGSRT